MKNVYFLILILLYLPLKKFVICKLKKVLKWLILHLIHLENRMLKVLYSATLKYLKKSQNQILK